METIYLEWFVHISMGHLEETCKNYVIVFFYKNPEKKIGFIWKLCKTLQDFKKAFEHGFIKLIFILM